MTFFKLPGSISPRLSCPQVPELLTRSPLSKDNDLETRLSKVKNLLDKNNFPELSFFVHDYIDGKPTVVLLGQYKSSRDMELFTLLNSKEIKSILPENIVVEWMHGDENFPGQTILESHPNYS